MLRFLDSGLRLRRENLAKRDIATTLWRRERSISSISSSRRQICPSRKSISFQKVVASLIWRPSTKSERISVRSGVLPLLKSSTKA